MTYLPQHKPAITSSPEKSPCEQFEEANQDLILRAGLQSRAFFLEHYPPGEEHRWPAGLFASHITASQAQQIIDAARAEEPSPVFSPETAIDLLCRQRKTPFRPNPQAIQQARELVFDPPLDEGIREIVIVLASNEVETFESCQGGDGHCFPEPTVRFEGDSSEGLRALSVALAHGLPVTRLRRVWGLTDALIHGPWWELTFSDSGSSGKGDSRQFPDAAR